ncbi:hypothetical protein [Streptomyces avermitilis]
MVGQATVTVSVTADGERPTGQAFTVPVLSKKANSCGELAEE